MQVVEVWRPRFLPSKQTARTRLLCTSPNVFGLATLVSVCHAPQSVQRHLYVLQARPGVPSARRLTPNRPSLLSGSTTQQQLKVIGFSKLAAAPGSSKWLVQGEHFWARLPFQGALPAVSSATRETVSKLEEMPSPYTPLHGSVRALRMRSHCANLKDSLCLGCPIVAHVVLLQAASRLPPRALQARCRHLQEAGQKLASPRGWQAGNVISFAASMAMAVMADGTQRIYHKT